MYKVHCVKSTLCIHMQYTGYTHNVLCTMCTHYEVHRPPTQWPGCGVVILSAHSRHQAVTIANWTLHFFSYIVYWLVYPKLLTDKCAHCTVQCAHCTVQCSVCTVKCPVNSTFCTSTSQLIHRLPIKWNLTTQHYIEVRANTLKSTSTYLILCFL